MSSHNPLRPKSSLLEQKAKSRSGLQMVMIIVAVHAVFLGGLLFSGCRPEEPAPDTASSTAPLRYTAPSGRAAITCSSRLDTSGVLQQERSEWKTSR